VSDEYFDKGCVLKFLQDRSDCVMSSVNKKALVIGGGIGGLATAIALRQAGMDVQVFEAVREVKEVGAGITVWSNAVKAIQRLGLKDELEAIGMPATYRSIYTARGELLSKIKVDQLANGLSAPMLLVHRADLQGMLLRAFGEANVQLGTRCVGFTQDEKGVCARFENGSEAEGDLLVIADGIRSALRAQLFGNKPFRYSGYATWRGIASLEDEHIPVGVSSETWGRGRRIGLIPLDHRHMYWFAGQNLPQGAFMSETADERKQRMRDLFRGWHKPIEAVIEATEPSTIIRADIYEMEPLDHWCQGRIALMGDAGHPMTPNMGQGACQALEDAVVLGACVQDVNDLPTALRVYEAKRIKRVNRVAKQSHRIGVLSQLEHPLACGVRDFLAKRMYTQLLSKELDWLLNFNV